jgi:putative glycosyltransferase (TIGR04348 family)
MSPVITQRLTIALITPALHEANNGNWQTAQRWATMLGTQHHVELAQSVATLTLPLSDYDAMIALHARRSAASVAAFAHADSSKPLWVVLTGTDLYRDIASDASAQRSLQLASQLIVLQEHGVIDLPPALRAKAATVFQSAARSPHLGHAGDTLNIAVVGHLRAEKSPETVTAVVRLLADKCLAARVQHVGKALDESYADAALRCQTDYPQHYQWLGGLPHTRSVALIASSDLLLHPSAMEGGSLAIIEAVQSGTPVIASRVAGHIGLLGADYGGFFEWNDAQGCTALLERYLNDATFKAHLQAQCTARSVLFEPATESQTLLKLLTI